MAKKNKMIKVHKKPRILKETLRKYLGTTLASGINECTHAFLRRHFFTSKFFK